MQTRHAFVGPVVTRWPGLLERLGGERIVHGHSIIATLTEGQPREVSGPLSYIGGRVLAVDGGIYGGGSCLVVRLDQEALSEWHRSLVLTGGCSHGP